jgi:hypothetical protein
VSYLYVTPINDPQDQTSYHRDPWRSHLGAVDTLRAAGIAPPAEWTALLGRYGDFIELANPAADRLISEIISPSGADVPMLRAAALAEEVARTGDDGAINQRLQEAVLERLVDVYAPHATRCYKAAASAFDDAAGWFTDAARTVDVEAGAESLLTATPTQLQAWHEAPTRAADLEARLHVLLAAAALAGARPDVAYTTDATDTATAEVQIALCTNVKGQHRRRVWEAWATRKGRCGRWSALRALNVEIRAARDPAGVAPYKRPEKLVAVAGPGGRIEQWDPHSGDVPAGFQPVRVGWMSESPSTTGVL